MMILAFRQHTTSIALRLRTKSYRPAGLNEETRVSNSVVCLLAGGRGRRSIPEAGHASVAVSEDLQYDMQIFYMRSDSQLGLPYDLKTNKKLSYRRDSARCGCRCPQPKSII